MKIVYNRFFPFGKFSEIAWLKGAQRGDIIPGLPLSSNKEGNKENTTGFRFGSNPKQ